jgi:hypothetical protein
VVKHFVLGGALVAMASAAPLAQGNRDGGMPRDQVQARYNISVMEGVLERAVDHGAENLRRQVRRVMPDMLLLSGGAEARGFRLEGYGVFFDVEVPVMRRSMAWSLKAMVDEGGLAALQSIKAFIESNTQDPSEKAKLLQNVKRLEAQFGPPMPQPIPPDQRRATVGPAVPAGQREVTALEAGPGSVMSTQPTKADNTLMEDPSRAYEEEVISALKDAMLDHSGPIGVGNDEWLTIAARDNEHRDRLVPGDPYDLLTIVLRVRGSDLAAFRADRISRDEARKRVEVREF